MNETKHEGPPTAVRKINTNHRAWTTNTSTYSAHINMSMRGRGDHRRLRQQTIHDDDDDDAAD